MRIKISRYLGRIIDGLLEKEFERRRNDEVRATIHMWDAHRELLLEEANRG